MDKGLLLSWLNDEEKKIKEEMSGERFDQMFLLGMHYQNQVIEKTVRDGSFDNDDTNDQ